MKTAVKKSLLAIAISGIIASPAVNATNGYFSHGYSTKEKGLAGAGTAFSQDALAAATNPAGMAFVGGRMDIGAALFSPSPRSYKVTGTPVPPGPAAPFGSGINAVPGERVESENDLFVIPYFGYNWQIASDKTVGVSIYGNGGMNTEYKASNTPFGAGTFGTGTTGVNLEQLFINTSFSKKLNSKHAVGASLIIAYQRFSAQGVEGFAALSLDPDNMSGDKTADSLGAGLKVGYQGEVKPGIRVGASYQSKISMGEFDEYKGLFAEGGDFDIPSTYNIGVSFDVGSTGVIVADLQRINYSDVAAISNPIGNTLPPGGSCIPAGFNPDPAVTSAVGAGCLGGANGGGFGWEDITILKIGYQMDVGDNTYRVGYSRSDQPIPKSQTLFNILAPAVVQNHVTAGWTMKIGSNQEFNLSAMMALEESVKGDNPVDGGSTQVEIQMSQYEIQAGWAWKY
ncbi:putative facilitator of salicylate uptake [hydrothermal vent metagenome]|uniref:Putative facilitator of salicylate uptake n=1 Tax=hydrothermal vent metagenome TaxID=652676 RepID=A0A3B0XFI6_9ZZZZ